MHQRLRHAARRRCPRTAAAVTRSATRAAARPPRRGQPRIARRCGPTRCAKRSGSPVMGHRAPRSSSVRPIHSQLQRHQQVDHAHKQRQRGAVLILARHLVQQYARTVVRDERWQHRRVQASPASRPSWAKNGGTTLSQAQPDVVGSRQRLDRFHVRIWTAGPARGVPRARRAPRRPTRGRRPDRRAAPTTVAAGGRRAVVGSVQGRQRNVAGGAATSAR